MLNWQQRLHNKTAKINKQKKKKKKKKKSSENEPCYSLSELHYFIDNIQLIDRVIDTYIYLQETEEYKR